MQDKSETEQRIEESLAIKKDKLEEHLLEMLKPSFDKDKEGELISAHVETFDFFKKGRINKSDCYTLIVTENFKQSGKQELRHYVLKRYDPICSLKDSLEREKKILGVSNVIGSQKYWFTGTDKEFRIFEHALSHKYDHEDFNNLLLLQKANEPAESLEEQIAAKTKVSSLDIVEALNPINLLHDYLPTRHYIDKKEPEGRELSTRAKEEVLENKICIPDFDLSEYMKNVETGIISLFNVDMPLNQTICGILSKISKRYLEVEDFKTIIQYQGYPNHNFIKTAVDASSVCKGPRALHLGCLIGCPHIFNRLDDREQESAIPDLIKGYLWRRDRLKEDFTLHSYIQPIDKDFLETSTYIGAILGNLYICSKVDNMSDQEKSEFRDTIYKQIKLLRKKENSDGDIGSLFKNFVHLLSRDSDIEDSKNI